MKLLVLALPAVAAAYSARTLTPRSHPPSCCARDFEASTAADLLRWYPEAGSPPVVRSHVATVEELGDPRLPYVAASAFPELGSKSQAVGALKRGALLLNGQPATGAARVRPGDELQLTSAPLARPAAQKLASTARFVVNLRSQGLDVPYEDEDVAVVFKPAGIHTKRQSNPRFAALEDALPAVVRPSDAREDALPLPLAMHRLDVPVCGVLLVAKTRRAALGLAQQLEGRRVHKRYRALLVGEPAADGLLEAPVEGLAACSRLTVLEATPHKQWGALSRVELSPLTGRTHQLRVHAAGIGCPIVGDDLYWEAAGRAREECGAPPLPAVRAGGLFLQSCGVRFSHPTTGDELAVDVAEADKFDRLWERARRAAEFDEDART